MTLVIFKTYLTGTTSTKSHMFSGARDLKGFCGMEEGWVTGLAHGFMVQVHIILGRVSDMMLWIHLAQVQHKVCHPPSTNQVQARWIICQKLDLDIAASRAGWSWGLKGPRGTHVNPWLIHVNVWQKPLQYCKVISLQLIKTNGEKEKGPRGLGGDRSITHSIRAFFFF